MDRAQENAIEIAKWLKEQDIVKKVVYPGFKEHPGYEIMKKQARGFGAMLTFELTKEEYAINILEKSKNDQIRRKSWWGGNTDHISNDTDTCRCSRTYPQTKTGSRIVC